VIILNRIGLRALLCVSASMYALVAECGEVAFADVTSIFARECVMCHQPYDAKGELTLHPAGAWKNIVQVDSTQAEMHLVAPGNLEQSYLYHKLVNTHVEVGGSGEVMPFDASLTAEQLETIRTWIEQGAKDN
jgi:hypothetical protein